MNVRFACESGRRWSRTNRQRYLRSAPIWVYNFENDDYSVPLGLGIGQVVTKGKTVYNFFLEPQYSVADRGAGQPQWQIYFGLNMQFKK